MKFFIFNIFVILSHLTPLFATDQVMAVGDFHGDLEAAKQILYKLELIDLNDKWCGGTTTLVQLGDQIDRGKQDKEVIDFFEYLDAQAQLVGGKVYSLIGNHETMNISLDFRYVASEAFPAFRDFYNPNTFPSYLSYLPDYQRGRGVAFEPGGPYAKKLAKRKIAIISHNTVFVHGGISLFYATYGVDRINRETKEWMMGEKPRPIFIQDSQGPLWNRDFSLNTDEKDCKELEKTLSLLKVQRMVVAHTRQSSGITHACNGKVWRIDTGMSSFYGGLLQALIINKDDVFVWK